MPAQPELDRPLHPLEELGFRLWISLSARVILIVDGIAMRLSGAGRRRSFEGSPTAVSIQSGPRTIDARLLLPRGAAMASVLILHGIGERLEYWQAAQHLLAELQIASLIFDYSGYGRSNGAATPKNLREDTIAAYRELQRLVPNLPPPFLLGLSLGTGVAADAAPHLDPPPSGLVLCEAFTSLRDAAGAVLDSLPLLSLFSRWLKLLMPDLYRTASSIGRLAMPVLILHSEDDELFPATMAKQIHEASGAQARLTIVSGFAHNDAYARPSLAYWRPILEFFCSKPA